MTIGATLLLLVFGMALAYAAGRADRRDLGAWKRRKTHHIDSYTVLRLHRHAQERRERMAKIRRKQ